MIIKKRYDNNSAETKILLFLQKKYLKSGKSKLNMTKSNINHLKGNPPINRNEEIM